MFCKLVALIVQTIEQLLYKDKYTHGKSNSSSSLAYSLFLIQATHWRLQNDDLNIYEEM